MPGEPGALGVPVGTMGDLGLLGTRVLAVIHGAPGAFGVSRGTAVSHKYPATFFENCLVRTLACGKVFRMNTNGRQKGLNACAGAVTAPSGIFSYFYFYL